MSALILLAASLLALLINVAVALGFLRLLRGESPFIRTSPAATQEITGGLSLAPGSIFYELGCGDGRLLLAAHKKQPEARLIGYEKNLLPYFLARWRTRNIPQIEIRRADLFSADLAPATHVFTYLFPATMAKLASKFERELKPGAQVFSLDFQIPNRAPEQIIELQNSGALGKKLFVYRY